MSSADLPEAILWSEEARTRVEKAPEFVRAGIFKVTEKRARERGYRVVTSAFLTEIRNESMLRVSKVIRAFGFEELSMEAFETARRKMKRKARKLEVIAEIEGYLAARTEKKDEIIEKFTRYLERLPARGRPWTEEALARIDPVPAFVRQMAAAAIEEEAKKRREKVITPEVVEAALAALGSARGSGPGPALPREAQPGPCWTPEARRRLEGIPFAFARQRLAGRVEDYAAKRGIERITLEVYEAAKAPGCSGGAPIP